MKNFHFGIFLVVFLLGVNGSKGQFLEHVIDIDEIILGKCLDDKKIIKDITTCVQSIEVPQQNASIEESFRHTCKVYPAINECNKIVRNCTGSEGLKLLNIDNELQKYMCSKDKDPLAEFLAAGGIECFNEMQNEIKACIKDFNYTFLTSHCSEIRTCMKDKLETCPSKTPANIVDEVFQIINSEIPCSSAILNIAYGYLILLLFLTKLF